MMDAELLEERFGLVQDRIRQINAERFHIAELEDYFQCCSTFILMLIDYEQFVTGGGLEMAEVNELSNWNRRLYQDIYSDNYETSYANPVFAVEKLGTELGAILSVLYFELRSMIVYAAEQRKIDLLIRMELFVEVYSAFVLKWEEEELLLDYNSLQQILYWYISDYSDVSAEQSIKEKVVTKDNFAKAILMQSDLSDSRYLYKYGEYISENEIKIAQFINELPQETIDLMADTYTEGYRIGFELGNKDLSIKQTVDIHYSIGFERMIRKAVLNFEKLGLQPAIYRTQVSIIQSPGIIKSGFRGANPNKQYDFDHKDDKGLFWDKALVSRKLEVFQTAFEKYKEEARLYAGPAVLETFGEMNFEPVNKKECISLTEEQRKLWVEYRNQMGMIQREFIPEEERSFTIIAFPMPEIGSDFEAIFQDVIKINTLDYVKYREIQQKLIDILDQSDYCIVRGMGENKTDLKVNLWKLKDPEKETIFENCVADVNIPVGEVFTSPVLAGTEGILHVEKVFLHELEYRNLTIEFKEGMITNYSCSNFTTEEENKAFVKENILYHQPTLPLGEFAIGTNTTAYVTAKKWNIEDKLPILIAEKMGPHFAVGDTCYSHAEDIQVFNPDGKEIVARENEVAAKRKTNPEEAYFNCHTDITIPYDELGELIAVKKDGTQFPIILQGRFVLPGCEGLNEAFQEA